MNTTFKLKVFPLSKFKESLPKRRRNEGVSVKIRPKNSFQFFIRLPDSRGERFFSKIFED